MHHETKRYRNWKMRALKRRKSINSPPNLSQKPFWIRWRPSLSVRTKTRLFWKPLSGYLGFFWLKSLGHGAPESYSPWTYQKVLLKRQIMFADDQKLLPSWVRPPGSWHKAFILHLETWSSFSFFLSKWAFICFIMSRKFGGKKQQ